MTVFEDEPIPLDEHYLHALREAAYDWGIESLADIAEMPTGRRAAIWFGRNIVTLIDEVRALRARLGDGR